MKDIKVLVFPCGSEVGLEIFNSLKDIRYVELFGASSVKDHGSFVYKNYYECIPNISNPSFKKALCDLVLRLGIDVIFPALDSVTLALAEIEDEIPCKIVVSDYQSAKMCRNKIMTYHEFSDSWFNPLVYAGVEEVKKYPVIIKPSVGQGSQGFKVVQSKDELVLELSQRQEEQVICEYLPGEEYTVDCFTDRFGVLRFRSPRTRSRTKSGISVNSSLVKMNSKIDEIAISINDRLKMRGAWFFQIKKNFEGDYRLLEIAPRVAGTMGLSRVAGVNIPLLSVLDALDYDVEVCPRFENCEVDRALSSVFNIKCDYGSVYIDFDDTLVGEGKVILPALQFVYQCFNKGIPVFLITRHAFDILNSLKEARISALLFDEIITVPKGKPKSAYIDKSRNPVFIDDSFSERNEVSKALGIKTFGLDSLECLMDTRG